MAMVQGDDRRIVQGLAGLLLGLSPGTGTMEMGGDRLRRKECVASSRRRRRLVPQVVLVGHAGTCFYGVSFCAAS